MHFLNIEKIQYITGSINREKFLENNMNKMSRAYPNFGVLDYINNLEDSTTIVSMYVGNDYYINPKINFIDSRIVDRKFYNKTENSHTEILDKWRNIGAEYLFVNKNYLGESIDSKLNDYKIIMSDVFRKKHLSLVKSFDSQEVYTIKY